MRSEFYIKLGRRTALVSFIIGTLLLALYALTFEDQIISFGLFYVLIAVIVNLLVFTSVFVYAFDRKEKRYRKKLLLTNVLMLLNIPVVFIYIFLVLEIIDTMRITLINDTENVITDINITGCQYKHINELEIGETKTIWINSQNECSININYLIENERYNEIVDEYFAPTFGNKMRYEMKGENN